MTWKSKSKTKSPHFVNSAKELLSKQFSNSPLMIMEATLSKISCFLPPNPPAGLLACLLNPYWRAIWTCLLASLRPAPLFACTACVLVIAFCQDFCLSLIENFALYWQFMTMHHASERP